jgi:hypothetical protein
MHRFLQTCLCLAIATTVGGMPVQAAPGGSASPPPNAVAAAPSTAMSKQLCGRPYETVYKVYDLVADTKGIKMIRNDDKYIAFDRDPTGAWWTFVKTSHPAGPAAVCRKLVEDRGKFFVHMEAVCHGPKKHCDELIEGFQRLLKTD